MDIMLIKPQIIRFLVTLSGLENISSKEILERLRFFYMELRRLRGDLTKMYK